MYTCAQFRYKLPPVAPRYLYADRDSQNHVDWKSMKVCVCVCVCVCRVRVRV